MTDLTAEQLDKIKNAVNKSSERYEFVTALPTDKERKLAVVTVYKDGELNTCTVKTEKAPDWLDNDDQFDEVVEAAVDKLGSIFK